jgi:hypothetical protein
LLGPGAPLHVTVEQIPRTIERADGNSTIAELAMPPPSLPGIMQQFL